jgi:hypothetical protein
MNTLPTIEKLPSEGPVTVTFASGGGTLTVVQNTAGASVNIADSQTAVVTPAGATNFGHVELLCVNAAGEVGRGQVVFLIPVTFS